MPGDRIMFVNSSQLQHASLDTAVQVGHEEGIGDGDGDDGVDDDGVVREDVKL